MACAAKAASAVPTWAARRRAAAVRQGHAAGKIGRASRQHPPLAKASPISCANQRSRHSGNARERRFARSPARGRCRRQAWGEGQGGGRRFHRCESRANRFVLPPPSLDARRIRRRRGKKGLYGLAAAAIQAAIDKTMQFRLAHGRLYAACRHEPLI